MLAVDIIDAKDSNLETVLDFIDQDKQHWELYLSSEDSKMIAVREKDELRVAWVNTLYQESYHMKMTADQLKAVVKCMFSSSGEGESLQDYDQAKEALANCPDNCSPIP